MKLVNKKKYLGIFIALLILLIGFQNCGQSDGFKAYNIIKSQNADTQFSISNKTTQEVTIFNNLGSDSSQYSPYLYREPGWNSTLMYYCRNSPINNWWRDRIWRGERWDGQPWNVGMPVLSGVYPESQEDITAGRFDNDDLSCSAGIGRLQGGPLISYYVSARRDRDMDLYLMRAISTDSGQTWSKKGSIEIQGVSLPIDSRTAYFETPSPIVIGGKINLYFIYRDSRQGFSGQKLFRMVSEDSKSFSTPQMMRTQSGELVSHGRVIFTNNLFVYTYSEPSVQSVNRGSILPDRMFMEVSNDGIDFTKVPRIELKSNPSISGLYVFSPMPFFENGFLKVYFAASNGDVSSTCWMCNSKIVHLDTDYTVEILKNLINLPLVEPTVIPNNRVTGGGASGNNSSFDTSPVEIDRFTLNGGFVEGSAKDIDEPAAPVLIHIYIDNLFYEQLSVNPGERLKYIISDIYRDNVSHKLQVYLLNRRGNSGGAPANNPKVLDLNFRLSRACSVKLNKSNFIEGEKIFVNVKSYQISKVEFDCGNNLKGSFSNGNLNKNFIDLGLATAGNYSCALTGHHLNNSRVFRCNPENIVFKVYEKPQCGLIDLIQPHLAPNREKLCLKGQPSLVTNNNRRWTWKCSVANNISNISCSANKR